MVQLHKGHTFCRFDIGGKTGETLKMVVRKAAQLARKTLPNSLHVRRTRHGDSEPAPGSHRQPVVFLVRERAVRVALLVGEGCEHKSVCQCWATLK
jgi:hypothetical protein